MNKSTDYHDYIFREGKLIGEFEEMYRNSSTTPWHQDEQENWIDVRLKKEILQDLGRFHQIHDFGCGTGHYLDLIVNTALRLTEKATAPMYRQQPAKKQPVFSRTAASPCWISLNEQRTTNNEQRTTNKLRGFT